MQTTTEKHSAAPLPSRERLLDIRQLATVLNVSVRSIYRLRDGGRLPAPVRVGCLIRWRAAEIDKWIESGCPAVMLRGRRTH